MAEEPVYRGILGIDIEGFSRSEWTDPVRARLRDRLDRLVTEAMARSRIAAALVASTDTGDGLLLLVEPGVSKARLLHLAIDMAADLALDNQRAPAAQRMRLRVVVHAGEMLADARGHTGASLNFAARLLDADAARAVLVASPAAELVVVVSDEVHEGVVRHGYAGVDPAAWQPVRVHAKETSTRAWVHLPGLAAQPRLPAVLVALRMGPASLPVPRELPCAPGDFTGREEELARVRALLEGALGEAAGGRARPVVISAIDGMAGIGKSALALQAAHEVAERFPDGQLYVDLRGASPGAVPLAPLEGLGRMLRSLGLESAAIPTEVEEAAARLRSLAAGRRLLVVLDNALDAQQVRPLLPASPTCAVLVTSRQVLTTLQGAEPLHLDVLPRPQAIRLLGRIAGEQRIAADPRAAAQVVQWCGYLPLAIRIAGARLAARPGWSVGELAERLGDTTRRLEELAVGELAVRASIEVSVVGLEHSADPLDRAAAEAFGLLSLPNGPDLGLDAAARLLDQASAPTRGLLERLVDAQLLESVRPGRYWFHDLVRLYARQHAGNRYPESVRVAALVRVFSFYTATTWGTLALLRPGDRRVDAADPRWTTGGLRCADAAAALAWLETERVNLLDAITQAATAVPLVPAGLAGRLASALFGLFQVRGYWQDAVRANKVALEAAFRAQDRPGQAQAYRDLGVAYRWLGSHDQAAASLEQSLAIYRELGDRQGQAADLGSLGVVHERRGHYARAGSSLEEGLAVFRQLDDRQGQANCLRSLGVVQERLGRYDHAIAYGRQSLAIFRELGDRWGQAANLNSLGAAYQGCGRYHEAIACQEEALTIFQELGNHHGQADALRDLGQALHGVGRHEHAREARRQALAIFEALQVPEADQLRR
jgi:tetratricopeptide (TPR) repeat protein